MGYFLYIFFFFSTKKLRAITAFPKLFVANLTWWVMYSFPTMYYKNLSFWYFLQVFYHFFMILCNCCSLLEIYIIIIDRIYCCFFLSNLDNLYMIRHHNFVSFIINNDFYFIALWMHYRLFISFFRRTEVNCYF